MGVPEMFHFVDKVAAVRSSFSALVGARLAYYETAELLLDGGSWVPWPDLPIRLYADTGRHVAVAWSGFDDLWTATDLSLPFSVGDETVRWVRNSVGKTADHANNRPNRPKGLSQNRSESDDRGGQKRGEFLE